MGFRLEGSRRILLGLRLGFCEGSALIVGSGRRGLSGFFWDLAAFARVFRASGQIMKTYRSGWQGPMGQLAFDAVSRYGFRQWFQQGWLSAEMSAGLPGSHCRYF